MSNPLTEAREALAAFAAAGREIVARRLAGKRKAAPMNRCLPDAEKHLRAALAEVDRLTALLAEEQEQRRIDLGTLTLWQRVLGTAFGLGETSCLDDVAEAVDMLSLRQVTAESRTFIAVEGFHKMRVERDEAVADRNEARLRLSREPEGE